MLIETTYMPEQLDQLARFYSLEELDKFVQELKAVTAGKDPRQTSLVIRVDKGLKATLLERAQPGKTSDPS